jgi:peptide/nickel transport system permease protein
MAIAEPAFDATQVDASPDRRARQHVPVAALVAGLWVALLVAAAVFADILPFVDDFAALGPDRRQPPSLEHWFGTDKLGRDVFSRAVYGARMSLLLAGSAVLCGLGIGGALGMIAGYVRGPVDTVISTVVEVMLSVPALILALAITSFLGHGVGQVVLALTLLSIAPTTRLVRSQTLQWAQRDFVTAARTSGCSHGHILTREVLPNLVPTALSFTVTGVALLMIAEGALAFLGQSIEVPNPTWGFMIAEGASNLEAAWWMSLLPAACLFVTLVALNILGDHISRRFAYRSAQ